MRNPVTPERVQHVAGEIMRVANQAFSSQNAKVELRDGGCDSACDDAHHTLHVSDCDMDMVFYYEGTTIHRVDVYPWGASLPSLLELLKKFSLFEGRVGL